MLPPSAPTPIRFNPKNATSHPLGVKPSGNLFLSEDIQSEIAHRQSSLGNFFSTIDEEIIVEMFKYMHASDLLEMEKVSKYFLSFSRHVEIWRELFFAIHHDKTTTGIDFARNDWRSTVIARDCLKKDEDQGVAKKQKLESTIRDICSNVFSDLLYGPYRYSGLTPTREWLGLNNVERVYWKDMNREEFVDRYEKLNKPVIITGFVEDQWKDAVANWTSVSGLAEDVEHKSTSWACGSVNMTMDEFSEYIDRKIVNTDELQYFVFDTKTFVSSTKIQEKISNPIPFFTEDLFDLLSPPWRPDNAWLLVGAAGACSKWHVDPNATNAWNAIIKGEKKWILLPPHLGPPPGIEASSDGFAVRQPLTLMDWINGGYYEEMYEKYHDKGLVECTCKEGEIMFIPRGWWHCVMNTGPVTTIAVTQNYAARSSIYNVRIFLKKFNNCVSGISHQYRSSLWKEFDRVLIENGVIAEGDVDGIEEAAIPATTYANSCDSGNEDCDLTQFSFWENLGNRQLNFDR